MTKPKDVSFEERWPLMRLLLMLGMFGMIVFTLYEGIMLVTDSQGWPLGVFQPPTVQSYEEYVKSQANSRLIEQWVLGPLFLILAAWFGVKLIPSRKKGKEEVEAKA